MRRRLAVLGLVSGALGLNGCAVRLRSAPPNVENLPEPPRIAVDAAYTSVQAGKAVLVDVRSPDSYERERATGALLLPVDDVEQDPQAALRALPVDKQPILYCT